MSAESGSEAVAPVRKAKSRGAMFGSADAADGSLQRSKSRSATMVKKWIAEGGPVRGFRPRTKDGSGKVSVSGGPEDAPAGNAAPADTAARKSSGRSKMAAAAAAVAAHAKIGRVSGDADEKNDRKVTFTSQGTKYSVDSRYAFLKAIGTGAYGFVCAAKDSKLETNVAIKKIPDACDDLTDAKRILREIRLMRTLRHDNVLGILDMDIPDSYSNFRDIYMVTELMDTDLSKVLKRKQPLMEEQGKFFIYQILRALKYLHSANILHRDLKPANILINANCDAKICDFGLARWVDPEDQQEKTEYVVTRWYRAPELMLSHYYTNAIDMWSVGCIMADVLTRKTLFPGKDVKNQLELICGVIGKPSKEDMWYITSKRAQKFIADLQDKNPVALHHMFPKCNPQAIDLMSKLLQFDPKKRPTAAEALAHPYLEDYHDPEDEPEAEGHLDLNQLEPPSEKTASKEDMRRLLWEEAKHFHPDRTFS